MEHEEFIQKYKMSKRDVEIYNLFLACVDRYNFGKQLLEQDKNNEDIALSLCLTFIKNNLMLICGKEGYTEQLIDRISMRLYMQYYSAVYHGILLSVLDLK